MSSSQTMKDRMVKFALIFTLLFSIANVAIPKTDLFLALALSNLLLLGVYFIIKKNHVIIDTMAVTSSIMKKVRELDK